MSHKNVLTPKSIPRHLLRSSQSLWSVPPNGIVWDDLDRSSTLIISGSAFINPDDPYGTLGNPFAVVAGNKVKHLSVDKKIAIAQKINTPETVFINRFDNNIVQVTVYTPSGKELGACAHGFIGAIYTIVMRGQLQLGSDVTISTTLNTSITASVSSDGIISLAFESEDPKELVVSDERLSRIYGIDIPIVKNFGLLSVGSPKLTIELAHDIFMRVQQNLSKLNYDELLRFQKEVNINGIHLFCRNSQTRLPENVIQTNAYLGKDNVVDLATGVSCAAQVSADIEVKEGNVITLTQYTAAGPSAELVVTKKEKDKVLVGGAAVLFNYEDGNAM